MVEINYKFKKYIPQFKKFEFPAITIMESCIRLNQHCREFIQRKSYCELFYDEDEKVIALKPTHVETFSTLRIVNKAKDDGARIQCTRFIRQNEIFRYLNPLSWGNKSVQIPAQWDEKNKCFFINLKYFKEKANAKQS